MQGYTCRALKGDPPLGNVAEQGWGLPDEECAQGLRPGSWPCSLTWRGCVCWPRGSPAGAERGLSRAAGSGWEQAARETRTLGSARSLAPPCVLGGLHSPAGSPLPVWDTRWQKPGSVSL